MRREVRTARAGYLEKIERVGLSFHTLAGEPYWNESAAYVFDEHEIEHLESASRRLHEICLQAVEEIVARRMYDRLGIPISAHDVIAKAWEDDPPAIYGRFDLRYDGTGPPKLLEYNADTPTSLLEAAVVQWHWLQDEEPQADQFNSIWDGLVLKWRALREEGYLRSGRVHFACIDAAEDLMTTAVLMDTAQEAGIKTKLMDMREIGWDLDGRRFVDSDRQPIETLFKLYPWEWMLQEDFGPKALETYAAVQWIEPIWKMVLSNKAILAILWEMFPEHPNLLPAYLDGPHGMAEYVRKPLLGREGANVTIVADGISHASDGEYDTGDWVYQSYAPLPVHDGNHVVIGSWVIDGEARGIGIRESNGPVTRDNARFVPHYFQNDAGQLL